MGKENRNTSGRPRGVISERDREKLRDHINGDQALDPELAKRIRDRVHHSLIDFQLLAKAYDGLELGEAIAPSEHEGYYDPGVKDVSDYSAHGVRKGNISVIEVLYRALGTIDGQNSEFEIDLGEGIQNALHRMYLLERWSPLVVGPVLTMGVENSVPLFELKQDYYDGEPLFHEELRQLYWGDEISEREYVQSKRAPKSSDLTNPHQTHFSERRKQRGEQYGIDGPLPRVDTEISDVGVDENIGYNSTEEDTFIGTPKE